MCLSAAADPPSTSRTIHSHPSPPSPPPRREVSPGQSHKNEPPRMNEKFEPLNFSLNESKRSERWVVLDVIVVAVIKTSAGSEVVQHFFPGTSAAAVAPYWSISRTGATAFHGTSTESQEHNTKTGYLHQPTKNKKKKYKKWNKLPKCRQTPRTYQRPKQPSIDSYLLLHRLVRTASLPDQTI